MTDYIGKRELFEKLLDVQNILRAHHNARSMEHGPASDPTRGRGRVIALLKLKDGVSTREMAEILGIRVSSVNEVVAKLEKDGYVERARSEEDGRVVLVKLTDKGREERQGGDSFEHDCILLSVCDRVPPGGGGAALRCPYSTAEYREWQAMTRKKQCGPGGRWTRLTARIDRAEGFALQWRHRADGAEHRPQWRGERDADHFCSPWGTGL